jgi:hypothetical protein
MTRFGTSSTLLVTLCGLVTLTACSGSSEDPSSGEAAGDAGSGGAAESADAGAGTGGAAGDGSAGDAGDSGTGGTNAAGAGSSGSSGSSGAGGNADPSCEQAAHFLDVSQGDPGPSYPAPSLSVTCDADEVTVASNGIPNFEFTPITPNALTAQDYSWHFPRYPAPAASKEDVPLGGPFGIAVNGLPLFGPTENPMHDYRDPALDEILDYCNGHTAPGGVYHFHARPDCLFTDVTGKTSLVVGYAFDGYPILAPYECTDAGCSSVKKMESSWQRVNDRFDAQGEPDYTGTTSGSWELFEYVEDSGDLDRCNGAALLGGGYAYYATDTFPYFIGCFNGTKTANAPGGGGGGGGPGGPGGP